MSSVTLFDIRTDKTKKVDNTCEFDVGVGPLKFTNYYTGSYQFVQCGHDRVVALVREETYGRPRLIQYDREA